MSAVSISRDSGQNATVGRGLRAAMRLGAYASLAAAALLVVFVAVAVLPGDAASQQLGLAASPEALARLRAEMGLDRPVLVRFGDWALGLMRGDWGVSAATGTPVIQILEGPATRSAALAILAGVGIGVFGVLGGIAAGSAERSWLDRALVVSALAALCTPEFIVGTAFVFVFATTLGWLPAVSLLPAGGTILDRPESLILPALTVTVVGGGALLRQVRAIVADQARRQHVEAAQLAGLRPPHVVLRHIVPGALPAIAQASALLVPYIVGGAVIVERVFGFPGIGSTLVAAVASRDTAVFMGSTVVLIVVSVMAYAVADLFAKAHP